MKARIKWAENRTFIGTSGTGHSFVMGTKHGDTDVTPGPSPMELVLLGVGGCSAYDVLSILEKGRQKVDDVQVELDADRAETEPKVFTKVHLHFIVKGRGVDPKRVERAIDLSIEKYCSASAMVGKTAEMTHDYKIVETGE